MSRLFETSLMFPLPGTKGKIHFSLCRFSFEKPNACSLCLHVFMWGGTLPQYFKFGKVDGVPDEHCKIDGFH